jgi:anti-sigma28 factor (negative regulator of flagellin synthesis)
MENTRLQNTHNVSTGDQEEVRRPRRKRSMTTLKLQWLAERVRKCRRIKEAVDNGTYNVDSSEVAKALLNVRDDQLDV